MANTWVVYTNKDAQTDALEVDETIPDAAVAKMVSIAVHGTERVATSFFRLKPGEATNKDEAIELAIDNDFLPQRTV